MKKTLFILSLLFLSASAYSQTENAADTIFKKNKEVLLVKITEIGIDEVKYKPIVNPNNIVLVLEKSEISRIVFANGVVQTFEDPLTDKKNYAGNHKNSIKFNFLSPIGDRTHFNWERSIKPGISYEVGLNLIGLGRRFGQYTPVGATINGGFRFYRMPEMKSRSDRYSHLMNGSYFQPTITLGMTQHSYRDYGPYDPYFYGPRDYTIRKANTNFFMFSLNFGKQYVFANRLSFDFSTGIGYGTYTNQSRAYYYYGSYYDLNSNENAYENDDPTRYGFMIFEREVPLALNVQFKLGYLFK